MSQIELFSEGAKEEEEPKKFESQEQSNESSDNIEVIDIDMGNISGTRRKHMDSNLIPATPNLHGGKMTFGLKLQYLTKIIF